jgi:hypothetical protein
MGRRYLGRGRGVYLGRESDAAWAVDREPGVALALALVVGHPSSVEGRWFQEFAAQHGFAAG